MINLKQIFCCHKYAEIDRFYIMKWSSKEFAYVIYAYKVYRCCLCEKIEERLILSKAISYAFDAAKQIDKIKSYGYKPYEEYMLS